MFLTYLKRCNKLHPQARLSSLSGGTPLWVVILPAIEHLTLEMLAYGRQKPAYSHFVARIFRKILAEHLTHFIRKLL